MRSLAETQQQFARAIFSGTAPDIAFALGPVSVEAALRVHRNTVLGALVSALRLVYPCVDKLVGEAFFDAAAAQFALVQPPTGACLASYGEGFAEFLQGYEPAAGLAYLPDVARLELAIDRAALGPGDDARTSYALDNNVWMDLPQNLCVLCLEHPADLIKDALEAGDNAALAAIDLGAGPRWLVTWRMGRRVAVKPVGASAGNFLRALLAGVPPSRALASADASPQDAAREIQQDIFAASFCHIRTEEP